MLEVAHHSEQLGLVLMLQGDVDLVVELNSRRGEQLPQDGLRSNVRVASAGILER